MFEERSNSGGGIIQYVCYGAADVFYDIRYIPVPVDNIIDNIPKLEINGDIMWNDTQYSISNYIYYANRYG
jgi:hypothetical protein